jgi:nitrate reductase gamma subunit
MNSSYMFSLIAVIVLFLFAYAGVSVAGLDALFGVVFPYLAIITFVVGFIYKVNGWARSAVPFRITTTGGQGKSLPWVQSAPFDNPTTPFGVVVRMALEIFCFRSLFRNTKSKMDSHGNLTYWLEIWLWLAALTFHYAFLVIILRHMRFLVEPVPFFVPMLETLDGFFQVGQPGLYLTDILILAAALYLFVRRVIIPQVRYISLPSDYFPLFLIIGIAASGVLMRYFTKIDVVAAKELSMGLVTFRPSVPEGIGAIFYVHLFLVSVLLAYFPFSKLMHLGGIFLSPTRNLPNDTRINRHANPWNYPVKVHTYEEYEDDFREKMIEAGLPVEKKE